MTEPSIPWEQVKIEAALLPKRPRWYRGLHRRSWLRWWWR